MTGAEKNNPIKVCFTSPKAYPLFNPEVNSVFGGAEVDLYLLATELAKDDGFEVSCITADYDQPTTEKIENVTIIKSLSFKQNQITGAIKIWKAMKKADADIYMMKTPSPGVPLVAEFCKVFKRHFAYRAASEREFNGVYLSKHPILGRLFLRSLRSASLITLQNQSDAERLQSLVGIEATVIPNGHRLPLITNTPKQTILWVGRSAPIKRPDLFLELAEMLPDEKFTMICQKATRDNNYQDLVAQAMKIQNLEFIEQVPFKEIETFFREAKVLVNTSDSEGFPNTFIQAAKYETVIMSLNVNPDNFLQKHNCGIHAKGSMQKIVDSMKSILEDNHHKELGKNARKYVEKYHDIKQITKQYKILFRKMSKCQ